jgi:DNA repair protein RecO (recombination protein O)
MATNKKARIDTEPVFILHQYPYRETSLLLDVFSQSHGRFSVTARGARRPGSTLRGILMAFQPILFSWFGTGELKTLHRAEWQGGVPHLSGLPLLCGFYMNELLMKLLPRDDPVPALFSTYYQSITRLARVNVAQTSVEPVLREFELNLLRELGYGFDLQHEHASGIAIEADREYAFQYGCGLIPHYAGVPAFKGQTLLDLAQGNFSRPETLQQSKILMRQALAHELNGASLHTRQILLDLQML